MKKKGTRSSKTDTLLVFSSTARGDKASLVFHPTQHHCPTEFVKGSQDI